MKITEKTNRFFLNFNTFRAQVQKEILIFATQSGKKGWINPEYLRAEI
jgi:hypothetical protein